MPQNDREDRFLASRGWSGTFLSPFADHNQLHSHSLKSETESRQHISRTGS